VGQRCEQGLVEQLVAQPSDEGFREGILLRLAGSDVDLSPGISSKNG
jgi:hypothetical protein